MPKPVAPLAVFSLAVASLADAFLAAAFLTAARGFALLVAVLLAAAPATAQLGGLQVEIRRPATDLVIPNQQRSVEVGGRAEIQGGVRNLDLFLVLDTSKSLRKTDPENARSAGAVGLVKSLLWTDARIGVVDFDKNGKLISPLTSDRNVVMKEIRELDQNGKTDVAKGIQTALEGFQQGGRPGSVRVMLLFTDGRVAEEAAREAMESARSQGVLISTLLLGSNEKGAAILSEIAEGTGGSFVAVKDPSDLPDAFLSLRTGVQRVELQVNDADPVFARLTAEGFSAELPLAEGSNRIVARARSIDGQENEHEITVRVRAPGCAEVAVRAEHDGKPALSVSKRAVEIVVDASGSMWAQMGGRTKIEIAKQILDDALGWLPPDLNLSLRAYGHQSDRREQNCEDSELLVPPGSGNRDAIRSAIAGLTPQGQTPIGYSLAQVSDDFGGFQGERAVVLVTDGLESCDGDATAEARALQEDGPVPVHVIGFGLGGKGEDLTSLRAIADASGGRFITAGSAAELKQALSTSVGTPFRVRQQPADAADHAQADGKKAEASGPIVARGTLGSGERIRLPAGNYLLQLDSTPAFELPFAVSAETSLDLVLSRRGDAVSHARNEQPIGYVACEEALGGDVEAR
jgi:Mg-chelatase subunit ChlD